MTWEAAALKTLEYGFQSYQGEQAKQQAVRQGQESMAFSRYQNALTSAGNKRTVAEQKTQGQIAAQLFLSGEAQKQEDLTYAIGAYGETADKGIKDMREQYAGSGVYSEFGSALGEVQEAMRLKSETIARLNQRLVNMKTLAEQEAAAMRGEDIRSAEEKAKADEAAIELEHTEALAKRRAFEEYSNITNMSNDEQASYFRGEFDKLTENEKKYWTSKYRAQGPVRVGDIEVDEKTAAAALWSQDKADSLFGGYYLGLDDTSYKADSLSRRYYLGLDETSYKADSLSGGYYLDLDGTPYRAKTKKTAKEERLSRNKVALL